MEYVSCNFCGSSLADPVGVFQDVMYDLPGDFTYARCQQCGLIYLQNRPTFREIGAYYPSAYQPYRKAIQDERFPWMRWARSRNIQKYCQVVDNYSSRRPGKILDVGCSTGIFLDAMRQGGWQTYGVEISPDAVQYARQRFGLNVYQGNLLDSEMEVDAFDAVTLWNVFEHLYQPYETLKYIHRLLRSNGILVMVYPNWDSLDRRLFGEAWVGYDAPRHLHIYPRLAAQKMLMEVGFEILNMSCGPNNYFAFTASMQRWLKIKMNKPLADLITSSAYFPGVRFLFQPYFVLMDYFLLGGTTQLVAIRK